MPAVPKPAHVVHLARRFFGSLDPRPPPEAEREWVRRHLSDEEFSVWAAMGNPDQRHSIEVARAVDERLSDARIPSAGPESAGADRSVAIAASLLHDSGKNASRLGTPARVVATLLRPLIPGVVIHRWASTSGPRRRLADYWRHAELGSRALAECGSHPLVAAWAAEHHLPEESWTVPPELGRILRDSDND